MKILYAEDNEEIASLLMEIIEENFPEFKVFHVNTGKKAIDYLQADVFDLVISDYSMPDQSGGDVLFYMIENNREEPFILITGEKINLLPEFKNRTPTDKMKFLNKPVDEEVMVGTIARVLNLPIPGEEDIPSQAGESGYTAIEISRIGNLNSAPCDIFLKLSEKKWIKVINKNGIEVQDIVNKYQPKGITNLYVRNSELENFNSALSNRIDKALDLKDNVSTATKLALAGDAILTIQEQLFNFGIDEEFVKHANKVVDHVIGTFKTDSSINELFIQIRAAAKGYLLQHSLMTAFLSNIIIKNSEWNSVSNQEKITMASLFHDISLTTGEFQDEESKSFLMGIEKEGVTVSKDFLDHPQKSVELLSKIPNMPDLFTIILEHHEKPDGTGFPRGHKANRLSPMSCILILAHHVCELIDFNQSGEEINILKVIEEKYTEGHFVQLVQSLKQALN